jgi:NitT/TauT family transport system ATP-binding protein
VPVMDLISRAPDWLPLVHSPRARFRKKLRTICRKIRQMKTLRTIVSWARYAELFAYDEQPELFSLENPH